MAHRGSNLADGGVTIDEGIDWAGVRTLLHYEGDQLIRQRQYDATPHLEHVQAMREANEGKNWGEGRMVGHIPALEYEKYIQPHRGAARDAAILRFFKENPKFCGYDKYLKG